MPHPRARETRDEWGTCGLSRILQTLARDNFVMAMTGETGIVKVRMPEGPPDADLGRAR
jgi:hypothetical protein